MKAKDKSTRGSIFLTEVFEALFVNLGTKKNGECKLR